MNIEAVIGANYGDEGKGLVTEYLCRSSPSPIVILSNGGCQRGHTVHNKELSCRHVFHHFGSGTLVGAPTILSKTFLLNPIKFAEEYHSLPTKPVVFRTPGCLIQLPGDMFTNQTLEINRKEKHGSCGWGIWETIVRNELFHELTFEQFVQEDYKTKVVIIKSALNWQYMHRLNGYRINQIVFDYMMKDSFIEHFIYDTMFMYQNTILLDTDNITEIDWSKYGLNPQTLIVENGQGLGLDQDYSTDNGPEFLHCTPSSCGLNGVIKALGKGNYKISANYVSRTYFTRHGNGPFPEGDGLTKFKDPTNHYNPYQGHMRFGKMTRDNFDRMQTYRIGQDLSKHSDIVQTHRFILTHCNENKPQEFSSSGFILSYSDDAKELGRII